MNKYFNQVVLFILFTVGFLGLYAQEQKTAFTLEEAKEFATKHSFVLKNSNNEVNKARKEIWKTITIGLPHVSASMNYSKNIMAAKTPFPVALIPRDFWDSFGIPADTPPTGTVPLSFQPKYNSSFSFNVNQLIFDGSYIVGVSSSKIYLELAKQQYEKTTIDIKQAVTQAYFAVLVGEESLLALDDNVKNTEKIYNDTKAYFEAGYREEQDVEQMQLLLNKAQNEVLRIKREIDIAKTVLKFAMGYKMDETITLTDSLQQFINPIVNQKDGQAFDFKSHIDYKLAYTNLVVKNKLVNLEKASFLPSLSAFYTYGRQAYGQEYNLFKGDSKWNPMSMIGLKLTMPIFNSGEKIFKLQQAKLNYATAENNLRLTEQTLIKDYLTASAQLKTAIDKFSNDKKSKNLASKIYKKTGVKFDYGMIGSIELAQANSQYVQSHAAYIASALQLLQANLTLKKIKGKL